MARKPTPFELVRPGILMVQQIAEANLLLALRLWGLAAASKLAAAERRRKDAATETTPAAPVRPLSRTVAAGDMAPKRPRAPAGRSRRAAGGKS